MKLAKKIPVFNKRHENLPEIILTLSDYNVPITRSVWYIKMLAAQVTNLNEVQKKKRQTNLDPSNEWTLPLVKFLRELFNRMKETINQPNHVTQVQQHQQSMVSTIESFMTNDNNNSVLLTMSEDKLKNLWDYATKLMRAMLDQNLLDKQLILDFIIDLLEKSRLFDKNLKYILTIGMSLSLYFPH
jgi:mediator of RNA polymerase II transcription subunit 12